MLVLLLLLPRPPNEPGDDPVLGVPKAVDAPLLPGEEPAGLPNELLLLLPRPPPLLGLPKAPEVIEPEAPGEDPKGLFPVAPPGEDGGLPKLPPKEAPPAPKPPEGGPLLAASAGDLGAKGLEAPGEDGDLLLSLDPAAPGKEGKALLCKHVADLDLVSGRDGAKANAFCSLVDKAKEAAITSAPFCRFFMVLPFCLSCKE